MSNCKDSASKLSVDPRSDSSSDCNDGAFNPFICTAAAQRGRIYLAQKHKKLNNKF